MTDTGKKEIVETNPGVANDKKLFARGTFNCFSNGSLFATGFGAGIFAFEGSSSIRKKAYSTYNPALGALQKYKMAEVAEPAITEIKSTFAERGKYMELENQNAF